MPKVSIIIPVYNVEPYLRKALDSVVNQTLADIEIICINDCSPDNSLAILEEYAQRDDRIKIINQETNQGQGVARNLGIDMATGEYIGFVDPDDWIEPNMYETLCNCAIKYDVDLVESFYTLHKEYKNKTETYNYVGKISYPKEETYNWRLDKEYPFSVSLGPCVKLFKTDFIRSKGIKFDTGKFAEDQIFVIKSRILASKIYFCDEYFYNYRIHKDSSTSVGEASLTATERIRLLDNVKQFLQEQGVYEEICESYWNYAIKFIVELYKRCDKKGKNKFDLEALQFIPVEYHEKYKKKKQYHRKFKHWIFSIKKMILPKGHFKVLTILGIKIPIQKYIR